MLYLCLYIFNMHKVEVGTHKKIELDDIHLVSKKECNAQGGNLWSYTGSHTAAHEEIYVMHMN